MRPAIGFATALFLAAMPVPASADEPVETQIVDVMNKLFGVYPGIRANHAKGLVVEGTFRAAPEAAALSRAVHFNGSVIPIVARFSDATGVPKIPDGSPDANPHGVAIKFHLPDGSDTDIVLNSLKFFPVATGEEFLALLTAVAESPPGAPKPTKVEQFVASHPAVAAANATVMTPDSLAHEDYYGINAFVFAGKGAKNRPSAITLCRKAACI